MGGFAKWLKSNSGQKKILVTIMAYVIVWNTRYFWEYLPGIFDSAIFLMLFLTLITLSVVGLLQLYKYGTEKPKVKTRLFNLVLIILITVLTYLKPLGLIDFKQFEGEDILYAMHEGTANCSISIRLKEGKRFKKTSVCFGTNHYWGNYEIVNDTLKFHYDSASEENKQGDYAILRLEKNAAGMGLGAIYCHSVGDGRFPMVIRTIKQEKFQ